MHQAAVLDGFALDAHSFQQDAVLHGLMPALDLALCLGMGGRAADMLDACPASAPTVPNWRFE